MSAHGHQTPAQIHSRLKHPVIDGDGHWVEFEPVFSERMRKVGGDKAARRFPCGNATTRDALSMSAEERRRRRIALPAFWSRQTENTLDRATTMMPRLLYERLDEIGTDFAIIYPTAGLRVPRINDDETRRAVVRAYNIVTRRVFPRPRRPHDAGGDHSDAYAGRGYRGTRVRTKQLGSKAGMFGCRHVAPVASVAARRCRYGAPRRWYDVLALDSVYDYDPVWAKCQELGSRRPSTAPRSDQGCASRRPISSTTISATSPPPAMRLPRRSSWAASPGASPRSASLSWKAGLAGRASCSAI